MFIATGRSLSTRCRGLRPLTAWLIAGLTLVSACDRTRPLTLSEAESQTIDRWLAEQARDKRIPGLAAAVMLNGNVVKRFTTGVADVVTNTPVTPDTPFQLASTTKSFASTAVMTLVADGRVSLEDRIGDRLDGLPESWRTVTLRQLLSHTSGLPDIVRRPGQLDLIANTWEDALPLLANTPRPFPAGEQWAYNQTNYALVALLVQALTGSSIDQYMAKRFFEPLQMSHTFFPTADRQCATQYERARGASPDTRSLAFPPFVHAAGGLCASLDDLLRWHIALDSGRVLPPGLQQEMWTAIRARDGSARLVDGRSTEYGLGWIVENSSHRRRVGSSGGNSSAYRRFVDEHMAIIVIHNGVSDPDGLVASIASIVRGEGLPEPASPQTRFWDAASFGDTAAISQALANGADIDALDRRTSNSGRRALNWAAWYDHPDAIRQLLARGATIEAENKTGFTALQHAAENGSRSAAEALLAAGADPRHANNAGAHIAETARANGNADLAAMIDAAHPQ